MNVVPEEPHRPRSVLPAASGRGGGTDPPSRCEPPTGHLPRSACKDIRIVDTLRRCYPAARVSAHHSKDGRLLFTTVDVAGRDLMAGRLCAIGDNVRQ